MEQGSVEKRLHRLLEIEVMKSTQRRREVWGCLLSVILFPTCTFSLKQQL